MRPTFVVIRSEVRCGRYPEDDHGDQLGRSSTSCTAPRRPVRRDRDRLVQELRPDGRREDAKLLAARRRPTQTADTLNRLARAHRKPLERLPYTLRGAPRRRARLGGRGARRRGGAQRLRPSMTIAAPHPTADRRGGDASRARAASKAREELGRTLTWRSPIRGRTHARGRRLKHVPTHRRPLDTLAAAFAAAPSPTTRQDTSRAGAARRRRAKGRDVTFGRRRTTQRRVEGADADHQRPLVGARKEEHAARNEAVAARRNCSCARATSAPEKAAATAKTTGCRALTATASPRRRDDQ